MFKSMIMAASLLLSARLSAQEFSISGIVRDGKSNQVLPGATVQLENSSKRTVTDEFGKFLLEKVSAGEYSLTASFIGYETKTQKLSVTASVDVTITLDESSQITDEVVVYATRANDKTPTTFTNVSGQTLQKQNFGQDLPLLLNWTPSLVTTSDAGAGVGYTGLRIRGSDATRINVTINGIPYNDSESQGTYWVDIPDVATSTQSIQVQRGVGTSTNGAGAFGGSVNVQTNSLRQDPYAELMAAVGSFNTHRYALKAGTGLINKWAFDGRVSKINSDGYIDRAASDLSSYYLSGGYYGNKTLIKAITFGGHEKTYQSWNGNDAETLKTARTFNSAGALYDDKDNVTGYYDNQVDDYKQDHYQLHVTQKLSSEWNGNVSLHYTHGRGYYENYEQGKNFSDYGLSDVVLKDTILTGGDFITRKWLDNKFYGGTFSVNQEKDKRHLTIGGAFNQYGHAKHFGEIIWAQYTPDASIRNHYYDGNSQKNDFNIYVKETIDITSKLSGFIDVQFRYVGYKTKGIDDDLIPYDVSDTFKFYNPKVGANYSLSARDVLYASIAEANREPNRTDYLNHDVKPKAERLDDVEIGWRRKSDRYAFEANYYLMNYRDQLVLTGKLDNVGNPIRANIGKSYRTGVELSGTARFTNKLTWNANATWSLNKNVDFVSDPSNGNEKKNTTIVLSPSWIAGSQLTYNVYGNFAATLLTKYVGKQYLDNTQTETLILKDYFVNDIRLNYTLYPNGMKTLDLSLLVNNIFDVKYSSNGVTYGDGVGYYFPQAGTNVMGMITMKF